MSSSNRMTEALQIAQTLGIVVGAASCCEQVTEERVNAVAVKLRDRLRVTPIQGRKNVMANITGGCLCGRVCYTVTGEPAFSGLCHCRNCQRYTGSAFEALIAFPAASVSVQGELKTYDDTGDSGQPVHRHFCPNCGSGVVN